MLSASMPEKELVAADCVDCCFEHTMAPHFVSSLLQMWLLSTLKPMPPARQLVMSWNHRTSVKEIVVQVCL